MGAKDHLILKTHFDWINTWFLDEFLDKYMLRFMGPLRIFLYNYVLYSFGLILNYISRFHEGGDRKAESDSENDGFGEELTNFLFQSYEDVLEDSREKREGGTYYSVSMELHSDFHENEGKGTEKTKGETESSVFTETHSEIKKDEGKGGEIERFVSIETHSDFCENEEKEADTKSCISMEVQLQPNFPGDGEKSKRETERSVLMEAEAYSDSHEDGKKKQSEQETECYVLMDVLQSDDHEDGEKREEEECSVSNSAITTRKYQYVSGRNISGFMEEPTAMSFTFREFYEGPNVPVVSDNNAFSNSEIIAQKQKRPEEEEEEEEEEEIEDTSVQENEFLGCKNYPEGFEPETLEETRMERSQESEEKHGKEGSDLEEEAYRKKAEDWKKVLAELEYDEENEGEFEWEHDDIVEQLKMELRHARQGGLPTIPEEEEQEQEEDDDDEEEEKEEEAETESPNEDKDQKHPKTEENNPEFQDQMDEIEEVYMIYEEKMRKLDILNYQTMHALGLLQLKEPLKSSFPGMKPLISHNIWPRKEAKSPLVKLVEELQRDLEMVYVGQVCLSWEILCWQHNKALQLKHLHYNSQYNEAADEFQLFQVLMQRFIENEAFQGPRTHNFVKNRCVIPNLLQVPLIRDDSVKAKNTVKGDKEYAVCSERLAEIIKESMWLFWKFVRADKDDGNLMILRVSHQTRTDLKDPALSDLAKDIRFHLHKKEKKLKDLVRSGNCIVRKFQKHQQQHEDQMNHEQLLAQVELKLVSRVLNLSKLRKGHLLWCNEKLNRIKFVKKEVVVEPSFLLFPC